MLGPSSGSHSRTGPPSPPSLRTAPCEKRSRGTHVCLPRLSVKPSAAARDPRFECELRLRIRLFRSFRPGGPCPEPSGPERSIYQLRSLTLRAPCAPAATGQLLPGVLRGTRSRWIPPCPCSPNGSMSRLRAPYHASDPPCTPENHFDAQRDIPAAFDDGAGERNGCAPDEDITRRTPLRTFRRCRPRPPRLRASSDSQP